MQNKDTSYSSIWLYEKNKDEMSDMLKDKIAIPIGRGSPTGKNNYSEFNPTLCKKIISFWSNKNDIILDPFAGRTRAFMSLKMERNYIGFELSKITYQHLINSFNQYQSSVLFPFHKEINIINDDSFNIDKYKLPKVDLIFTCPPYWNLEEYHAGNGDLSEISNYDTFLNRYQQIFRKTLNLLKENGYFVLVIGDFRRDGKYISFHSDNINLFEKFNDIKLYDIICSQSVTFDIANFRFGGFKHNKIVSKVHEYILVYKKLS